MHHHVCMKSFTRNHVEWVCVLGGRGERMTLGMDGVIVYENLASNMLCYQNIHSDFNILATSTGVLFHSDIEYQILTVKTL